MLPKSAPRTTGPAPAGRRQSPKGLSPAGCATLKTLLKSPFSAQKGHAWYFPECPTCGVVAQLLDKKFSYGIGFIGKQGRSKFTCPTVSGADGTYYYSIGGNDYLKNVLLKPSQLLRPSVLLFAGEIQSPGHQTTDQAFFLAPETVATRHGNAAALFFDGHVEGIDAKKMARGGSPYLATSENYPIWNGEGVSRK